MRSYSPILLALLLSACASTTGASQAQPQPQTYLWLAQPGMRADDARMAYRTAFDAQMQARGYARAAHPALALSIATDAPTEHSHPGFGSFAGGFTYFTPAAAPEGYVEVVAFDMTTLRPVWRARWPAASTAIASAAFETVTNMPFDRGDEAHDSRR